MKKFIAIALCLAMTLCIFACEKTDNSGKAFSKTIPIGDGVEDIDISGACFGTYKIIDIGQDDLADGEEVVTYYCADCDTPYIEVYSSPKNGMTLEEYTKKYAELEGNGYYQMKDNFGYYTCPWEDEAGFFYCAVITYEGTEKFHCVCYSAKTEEMHLGGNLYMWAPTGYTEVSHEWANTLFEATYDECYAMPNVLVTLDNNTYEDILNYYSFNGDVNITEEQYNEWCANWTEETTEKFYEAVGFKVAKTLIVDCGDLKLYGYILNNQRTPTPYSAIAYIPDGDCNYRVNLWCEGEMPAYPYLYAAMKSVHVKK